MVLRLVLPRARSLKPALIVPDEAAWTLWGRDPCAAGLAPAAAPEEAELLVLPDRVPAPLAAAVTEAWARIPPPRRHTAWKAELAGSPAAELVGEGADEPVGDGAASAADEHAHHGGGHQAHEADGHDHHDMMAVVGDPSADGLVMEPIDFALGPLAPSLPGGLVVELTLDGDVVAGCSPRAGLAMPADPVGEGVAPDPLARCAWAVAFARAVEAQERAPAPERTARTRVAAVEVERALSHVAWLRGFARTLGWEKLVELAQEAVTALLGPRTASERSLGGGLDQAGRDELRAGLGLALRPVERLASELQRSRLLRARTRGRAAVGADRLEATGVAGPAARAAGLERDVRMGDRLYDVLGFRVELAGGADAEARTLLRAREARASVRLALAALGEAGATTPGDGDEVAVEGPRGPLRVGPVRETAVAGDGGRATAPGGHRADARGRLTQARRPTAPGSAELLGLAGDAVKGLELAAALVGLSSFDLSPWEVRG